MQQPGQQSGGGAAAAGAYYHSCHNIAGKVHSVVYPRIAAQQRNYYKHVIRTERALDAIRQYIADNPARWLLDRYHPHPTGRDPRAAELWRLLREE